jgi:hypothetical protein
MIENSVTNIICIKSKKLSVESQKIKCAVASYDNNRVSNFLNKCRNRNYDDSDLKVSEYQNATNIAYHSHSNLILIKNSISRNCHSIWWQLQVNSDLLYLIYLILSYWACSDALIKRIDWILNHNIIGLRGTFHIRVLSRRYIKIQQARKLKYHACALYFVSFKYQFLLSLCALITWTG